jgi:hypothetical protein
MACRTSAGSVPPRLSIHCPSAHAAALRASPSYQGVTPNDVASAIAYRNATENIKALKFT